MNSFIISQWYKYREVLKQHYMTNFSAKDAKKFKMQTQSLCDQCNKGEDRFCDYCIKNEEILHNCDYYEKYLNASYNEIAELILENLLFYVINQGKDNKELTIYGISDKHQDGFCHDFLFLLRDNENNFWTLPLFFGSYDVMTPIPAHNKEEFVAIIMHLTLLMVQHLEYLKLHSNETLVIKNGKQFFCGIEEIISLSDLTKMSGMDRWSIIRVLEALSPDSLEPLLQLLSEKQKEEFKSLLYSEEKENDDLYFEMNHIGYSDIFTSLISNDKADAIINKLSEYNLKGYMAICNHIPYFVRGLTSDIDSLLQVEREKRNLVGCLEEEDKPFQETPYYLVVANSLDEIMDKIEQKELSIL